MDQFISSITDKLYTHSRQGFGNYTILFYYITVTDMDFIFQFITYALNQ